MSTKISACRPPAGMSTAKKAPSDNFEQHFLAASEQQHWKNKLEGDIGKMGADNFAEFVRLCELRRIPVPQKRMTDYRWLHYYRAEKLKERSSADNRILLMEDQEAREVRALRSSSSRTENARLFRKMRQR